MRRGKHRKNSTDELPVLQVDASIAAEQDDFETQYGVSRENFSRDESDATASVRDEAIATITREQARDMLAWFATKYPVMFDACTHEVL
jgi:hypothetical protein